MKGLLLVVVGVGLIAQTYSLSCPCYDRFRWETPADYCKEFNIPELTEADCKYGLGKDVCGCCDECKKGPGESCGGPWGANGECGNGLECVKEVLTGDEWYDAQFADGTCKTTKKKTVGAAPYAYAY